MATVDEMRAAYKAYEDSSRQDCIDQALGGIPSLLCDDSERTLAHLATAGDYTEGMAAAQNEHVSSSDSCLPVRSLPPDGASEGFWAGWSDYMTKHLGSLEDEPLSDEASAYVVVSR